jgi:hypothetical protein
VWSASSNVNAAALLRTSRSMSRARPIVKLRRTADSSLSRAKATRTAPSGCGVQDSRSQSRSRAKPWAGDSGAPAFGPNQGKQTGTPPRIGLFASYQLLPLMKRTGFAPRGWNCVR